MTLAIGTGRSLAFGPPRYLKRGRLTASAAALAVARETARIAFAPSFDLVSVPSRRSIVRSTVNWSKASTHLSAGRIFPVTFRTAPWTHLPRKRVVDTSG